MPFDDSDDKTQMPLFSEISIYTKNDIPQVVMYEWSSILLWIMQITAGFNVVIQVNLTELTVTLLRT